MSKGKYPSLKLFLTGLIFALIFDTSTQVAAWSLVGQNSVTYNPYLITIFIGLFFTIGMMLTDTISGIVFHKVINSSSSKFNIKTVLSILVVISSLSLGLIQLLEKIGLSINLGDNFKLIWGLMIVLVTCLAILINSYYNHPKETKIEPLA